MLFTFFHSPNRLGQTYLGSILGLIAICNVYAEPSIESDISDFLQPGGEVILDDGSKIIAPSDEQIKWESERFLEIPPNIVIDRPVPPAGEEVKLPFPAPPTTDERPAPRNNFERSSYTPSSSGLTRFIEIVAQIFLPKAAQAATYGDLVIDGSLSDWTVEDRINLPLDLPPYLATGDELYGKYVDQPTPTYVIALKSTTAALGPNTTLWLNTDQDPDTGYRVWGLYGGAEYFVNIYSDSTPHLYDNGFAWITGPLDYAYSSDQSIIEIAIPAYSLAPLVPPQSIDMLGDINDATFLFPQDYVSGGQYTLPGAPVVLPPRTDFSKRVGIVFGDSTKALFWGDKAYSQLFTSLQHQAMMAGISFDLLSENDLTDINNIVNYDALIFPYFANVEASILAQIHDTIYRAIYDYGIGIITADNWMTNDETGQSISGDAYRYMKQLLGIGRVDGEGPVDIDITAAGISHPAMEGYTTAELIVSYRNAWYSRFEPVPNQPTEYLAEQTVTGSAAGTYPAVIASTTGGRNVHFATIGSMADAQLVWQSLQWVVYGDEAPVGLKMGRHNNLFVSRNDMDQAQENAEVPLVHFPLYTLLQNWKTNYDFVGSFFIDIGNDPVNGKWTDWALSGPLFEDYIALGNEIGTHSWTHPHNTDLLSSAEIEFEFNQSMNEISANIDPRWRNTSVRGGAIPGNPEALETAEEIIQHTDYLTGAWSSVGAGFPSAFGYLTPDSNKVYLSPNMSFDFTLIQFGVPVGDPPVPVPLTAEEAEQYWQDEYASLMSHASQPIILWPWHDYGPTTSADPITGDGYTVAMYENTIAMAYNDGSEFIVAADAAQRLENFRNAKLTVDSDGSSITATVDSNNVGKFALAINASQIIESIDNWYAYNEDHVFLDDNGGVFEIQLGASAALISRITALPMRSRLISLSGDGTNLDFAFEGAGQVRITLTQDPNNFNIVGASSFVVLGSNEVGLDFDEFGTHSVSITLN